MRTIALLTIISAIFAPAMTQAAEVIGVPRVALVYSDYGDFRHRDDYDRKMKRLGWKMDKFENAEFGELAEKLPHYDILLGSALYNYSNVGDFSKYEQQLMRFMSRGGAIVWTDTNYTPHVNWLAKLGKSWKVTTENAPETGTPMKWLDKDHPIFNAPNEVRKVRGTWARMHPADAWNVISTSENDQATGLFRRHGRGFMMLTCYWNYDTKLLQNVWGTLQLHRAGLIPTLPQYSDFDLGTNRANISVENITDEAQDFTVSAAITDPKGAENEYRASAEIAAGETEKLTLQIPLKLRGDHEIATTFLSGDDAFYLWTYSGPHIPDLLTIDVIRPYYRGSVYTAAPPSQVELGISLHPWKEDSDDLRVAVSLNQGGKELHRKVKRDLQKLKSNMEMPLKLKNSADIQLHGRLLEEDAPEPLTTVTQTIPVVEPKDNQVFIGPDLATRVDGEIYFPIGIYHVGPENLAQAKEMGFNCFQGWGTTAKRAKRALDAGQKHGMKCILEMSGFLRGDEFDRAGLAKMVEQFADHPALLAWYTVDEPHGTEGRRRCITAHRDIVANEPHHPVYLVMCRPGSFAQFAETTDILAVDPYPIPGSVTMVSNWMSRAGEAVAGRKPVWMIPQLHNKAAYHGDADEGRGPTPAEERNMVYQGLIWGAKGIVYYPWDDGPCGLVHDEDLMDAVEQINSELATLGPKLLTCRRRVVAENDEAHPKLYAAVFENDEETYIIAASVAEKQRQFTVPAPDVDDADVRVMFEDRSCHVTGEQIVDDFQPLGVHVYHRR